MKNHKLSIEVQDAIRFLENHPGVCGSGGFLSQNFSWFMSDVCKNDCYKDTWLKPEEVEVRIYKDHTVYRDKNDQEFFKGKFDKFYPKYKDEEFEDETEIDVPYKEVYGYEWQYDHTKYVGEYCFLKYSPDEVYIEFLMDNGKANDKEAAEFLSSVMGNSYSRYQGGRLEADSFEELIIKIAEDVKEKYGDFGYDSFIKEEEKNPEGMWPFHFEDLNDGSGNSMMVKNEDYIRVEEFTKNLRWYEWYKTTDHYQENWEQYED